MTVLLASCGMQSLSTTVFSGSTEVVDEPDLGSLSDSKPAIHNSMLWEIFPSYRPWEPTVCSLVQGFVVHLGINLSIARSFDSGHDGFTWCPSGFSEFTDRFGRWLEWCCHWRHLPHRSNKVNHLVHNVKVIAVPEKNSFALYDGFCMFRKGCMKVLLIFVQIFWIYLYSFPCWHGRPYRDGASVSGTTHRLLYLTKGRNTIALPCFHPWWQRCHLWMGRGCLFPPTRSFFSSSRLLAFARSIHTLYWHATCSIN